MGVEVAFEIEQRLARVADRRQIRRHGRQGRVAVGERLATAIEPALQCVAVVDQDLSQLLVLDDIEDRQPRLADQLPFFPQHAGIDLQRGRLGGAQAALHGDGLLDVLRDAGGDGIKKDARSGIGVEKEQVAGADGRIRQQAGLQHLRPRHAALSSGRDQVGIVLDRQHRDIIDTQRLVNSNAGMRKLGELVLQVNVGVQRERLVGRAGAESEAQRAADAAPTQCPTDCSRPDSAP